MRFKEEERLYGILEERNIKEVQFGCESRFETWYGSSVYFDPSETNSTSVLGCCKKKAELDSKNSFWLDVLYVCEYCFKYTDDGQKLSAHVSSCSYKRTPPGRLKYRGPIYEIRRVKGSKHKLFSQCLCLFTKLFLDNKSMYFKIEQYEFYIVYKKGSTKPMGFFSRDLLSFNQNNLACVLVFPPYQKMHLGTLLIEFSYALSKSRSLISGPETPLSPFGLVTYIRFWARVICYEFRDGELALMGKVSLEDISIVTGFRITDIISTLTYLGCLSSNGDILISKMKHKLATSNNKITGYSLQEDDLLIQD